MEKLEKYFEHKKALVTGGSGLIGRQVVSLLSEFGAKVKVVSLDELSLCSDAEYIYGDLCNFKFCKDVTKDIDCVFHIAGIKGSIQVTLQKPASFFVPLLMMNTNLLEAARLNGVEKTVYTSSVGAYAPAEVFKEGENETAPPMDYHPGMAKRIAEQQISAYRTQYGLENFSVVRLANVYGPGDNFDPDNAMVIPSLIARIYNGENPLSVWGDGTAIRDFVYSRDVAKGIILALYHGTNSSYMNLGSGIGHTIKELVETLSTVTGCKYVFDKSKPSGFPKRVMDISLARSHLGYNPQTSLFEGLKETYEWFLNNQEEFLSRKNYFT